MKTFDTPNDAKEFFILKIIEQAERDNISLSDLEKKMLEFTSERESEYLDMNKEFEKQYDTEEYERKIISILKKVYKWDIRMQKNKKTKSIQKSYKNAFEVLSREDHYILIMIELALGRKVKKKWFRLF